MATNSSFQRKSNYFTEIFTNQKHLRQNCEMLGYDGFWPQPCFFFFFKCTSLDFLIPENCLRGFTSKPKGRARFQIHQSVIKKCMQYWWRFRAVRAPGRSPQPWSVPIGNGWGLDPEAVWSPGLQPSVNHGGIMFYSARLPISQHKAKFCVCVWAEVVKKIFLQRRTREGSASVKKKNKKGQQSKPLW